MPLQLVDDARDEAHGPRCLTHAARHRNRQTCARLVLALALLGLATLPVPAAAPNILLILADDLGFSDLGCYGGEIATPNLDALAGRGLRFTQFYNTARCWPTRAAILTGYYPQAVRRDALPPLGGGASGTRPRWARLLPELLRPLGYRSYHSGKWHVDGLRLAQGFDRSYSLEDHDRNFYPRSHFEDDRPLPAVPPGDDFFTSTAIASHAIRCLREHAERFPDRPFFEYLCFTSPHFPLQAPAADIEKYRETYRAGWDAVRTARWQRQRRLGLVRHDLPPLEAAIRPSWNLSETELQRRIGPGEIGRAVPWTELTPAQQAFQSAKMAVHAAMVDRMDQEIGRVLAQVKAMGAWDDTVILFLSDNGASAEQIIRGDGHDPAAAPGSPRTFLGLGPGWSSAANTPFRLHKSWTHEGGIATPLVVHWPAGLARTRPGTLRHTPGHVVDLPPTLLELAGGRWPRDFEGAPVPPAHGVSLVPALARDRTVARDSIWWFHDGHRALRVGDWKLVGAPLTSTEAAPAWELYHLDRDRGEQHDVAARYPARVAELVARWEREAAAFRTLAAP